MDADCREYYLSVMLDTEVLCQLLGGIRHKGLGNNMRILMYIHSCCSLL